jgi:hypothetical protein
MYPADCRPSQVHLPGGIEAGSCDRDSGLGALGFGAPAVDLRANLVTAVS